MMPSYHSLLDYRRCPRKAFFSWAWEPLVPPEAMGVGQLVHRGLASYFKGKKAVEAMEVQAELWKASAPPGLDKDERQALWKRIDGMLARAQGFLASFIAMRGQVYQPLEVEPSWELFGVVAHPDLLAHEGKGLVIVDFKTSKSPDLRAYSLSEQLDFYAFIAQALGKGKPDLVAWEAISDDGLFQHSRPPRLERGKRVFRDILAVPWGSVEMLDRPHFDWDCPGHCLYFVPCHLVETEANYTDYLQVHFKERKE